MALSEPGATAEAEGLRVSCWLLVRCQIDDTNELAYYLACGPKKMPAGG